MFNRYLQIPYEEYMNSKPAQAKLSPQPKMPPQANNQQTSSSEPHLSKNGSIRQILIVTESLQAQRKTHRKLSTSGQEDSNRPTVNCNMAAQLVIEDELLSLEYFSFVGQFWAGAGFFGRAQGHLRSRLNWWRDAGGLRRMGTRTYRRFVVE
jgi:hypothetical protein